MTASQVDTTTDLYAVIAALRAERDAGGAEANSTAITWNERGIRRRQLRCCRRWPPRLVTRNRCSS